MNHIIVLQIFHIPDSTNPNPDCMVKIIKALVKIHVASSELSGPDSSVAKVLLKMVDEFPVEFILSV